MGLPSSVVLSALEFDVLWASLRFPRRHVVLDIPSPGVTHSGRAELVRLAWEGLERRGLAIGGRVTCELADRLALLAHPPRSVDAWVWTDREIRALAAAGAGEAVLAVVDRGDVWLIPARETSFVEAAISVAGQCPAGAGRSVSVPMETLREADREVNGDPKAVITALLRRGIERNQAHLLAGMLTGTTVRGQFGTERAMASYHSHGAHRASRVVAFHDTPRGRYLYVVRPSPDGVQWATVTPADNAKLAASVWELLDELR